MCSIVLDDQSKMDIDAVSITGTDDDAVIVDSSVEEYCDDVDDGEASTSTVEVIPDELDIDEDFLAEEMDRNYVDSRVSILSALPSNPSDLAIKGAKILTRSLQNYVDSGCPEDNHYAGLTRHSSLAVFLNEFSFFCTLRNEIIIHCNIIVRWHDIMSTRGEWCRGRPSNWIGVIRSLYSFGYGASHQPLQMIFPQHG